MATTTSTVWQGSCPSRASDPPPPAPSAAPRPPDERLVTSEQTEVEADDDDACGLVRAPFGIALGDPFKTGVRPFLWRNCATSVHLSYRAEVAGARRRQVAVLGLVGMGVAYLGSAMPVGG